MTNEIMCANYLCELALDFVTRGQLNNLFVTFIINKGKVAYI